MGQQIPRLGVRSASQQLILSRALFTARLRESASPPPTSPLPPLPQESISLRNDSSSTIDRLPAQVGESPSSLPDVRMKPAISLHIEKCDDTHAFEAKAKSLLGNQGCSDTSARKSKTRISQPKRSTIPLTLISQYKSDVSEEDVAICTTPTETPRQILSSCTDAGLKSKLAEGLGPVSPKSQQMYGRSASKRSSGGQRIENCNSEVFLTLTASESADEAMENFLCHRNLSLSHKQSYGISGIEDANGVLPPPIPPMSKKRRPLVRVCEVPLAQNKQKQEEVKATRFDSGSVAPYHIQAPQNPSMQSGRHNGTASRTLYPTLDITTDSMGSFRSPFDTPSIQSCSSTLSSTTPWYKEAVSPKGLQEEGDKIGFSSLRYEETITLAGPHPRMHSVSRPSVTFSKSSQQQQSQDLKPSKREPCLEQGNPRECANEEEQHRPLTEKEIQRARFKRLVWALGAIALVLIATTVVLGGIIWKLKSMTEG